METKIKSLMNILAAIMYVFVIYISFNNGIVKDGAGFFALVFALGIVAVCAKIITMVVVSIVTAFTPDKKEAS